MNLIHCNCQCVYQQEGYCTHDNAAGMVNQANPDNGCLHFLAKNQEKGAAAFTAPPDKPPEES